MLLLSPEKNLALGTCNTFYRYSLIISKFLFGRSLFISTIFIIFRTRMKVKYKVCIILNYILLYYIKVYIILKFKLYWNKIVQFIGHGNVEG